MKDLITDIKEHFSHYLVLLFILLVGFGAFYYFQRFPQAQIVSAFLTASFYVFWGIVHHYLEEDLHLRIVIEYVAIALLGFLILLALVNRV
ncbi:MAG: hypothetical protein ACOX50_04020 [Patescibacteria group bacterium]|jgi:uncharacterized membrane protein YjjP (DUF1212 family)